MKITELYNINREYWITFILSKPKTNIYLVGGCVRDFILSKPNKDIDFVVSGLSLIELKNILSSYGKVDEVGESFSVIKFKPIGYSEPFDIAIPRIDKKVSTGHKGFEIITNNVSILEDLKRRDLTINSIAYSIRDESFIDPFNGLNDIHNGIIKATDENAFIEDPLRILRAIQFACRFNFKIEPRTFELMKLNALLIRQIPDERILTEIDKAISKGKNVKLLVQLLNESNISSILFNTNIVLDRNIRTMFDFLFIVEAQTKSKHLLLTVEQRNYIKGLNTVVNTPFDVSTIISKSSDIIHSVFLSDKFKEFYNDMLYYKAPRTLKDLKVNGNDILSLFPETVNNKKFIGITLEYLFNNAHKFNWRDKKSTIKFAVKNKSSIFEVLKK